MAMPKRLIVVFLFLRFVASIASVAPQDADPFCLADIDSALLDPREVVLLDTHHYRPQTLVTLFGSSGRWLSLKLSPGPGFERVCFTITHCMKFKFYLF